MWNYYWSYFSLKNGNVKVFKTSIESIQVIINIKIIISKLTSKTHEEIGLSNDNTWSRHGAATVAKPQNKKKMPNIGAHLHHGSSFLFSRPIFGATSDLIDPNFGATRKCAPNIGATFTWIFYSVA